MITELSLAKLKTISQLLLLNCQKSVSKTLINFLLQKINLGSGKTSDINCVWYQLAPTNLLKKDQVLQIIDHLSHTSWTEQPNVCIIECFEYTTIEAANSFLKFLENIPQNVYIFLITRNIQDILPTIVSRCQVFNLSPEEQLSLPVADNEDYSLSKELGLVLNYDFQEWTQNEVKETLDLLYTFIINDNEKKHIKNKFLIRNLKKWNQKTSLFVNLLFFISKNRILHLYNQNGTIPNSLERHLNNWKTKDTNFLIHLMESSATFIQNLQPKAHLGLLLTAFSLRIYEGYDEQY